MSNEVAKKSTEVASYVDVPQLPNKFAKDFGTFVSGSFLPRIQLEGSSSKLVRTKKIGSGHYALHSGKDKFEDLGEKVDLLVLTYRTKAVNLTDTKNIQTSYDKNSELFKSIKEKASQKGDAKKGYMFGLEFLVYIPDAKTEQKFATFFCGNPTHRVAARDFTPIVAPESKNRKATLKAKVIDNGEYVWDGPVVFQCNTELSRYPSKDEMVAQMENFLNPIEGLGDEIASDEESEAVDREV